MKHKKPLTGIIAGLLIAILASTGITSLITYTGPDTIATQESQQTAPDDNTAISEHPSDTDVPEPSNADPRDSYEPTTWNEALYPDMYRIDGPAIIPRNDLAPSDIRYEYDRDSKTQRASALLSYENYEYGQRERESLSDIEPIGWPDRNGEADVTFANGTDYHGWFWNRSHLIAHALGGDDEEYNLITGTRAQNVGKNDMRGGIQYVEQLVSDYLQNHPDGTVYYFVTPVYLDGENIPRSVFVDARSDDASINIHMEVYNAMPGYTIDYVDGTWS